MTDIVQTNKTPLCAIERVANRALDLIASRLEAHGLAVSVIVEDLADEETLEALFLEDPRDLLAVHSGMARALDLHGVDPSIPAQIWLFRKAILVACQNDPVELERLVKEVMLDECTAHYRWSDALRQLYAEDLYLT